MSEYLHLLQFSPTWTIIISLILLGLFTYLFHKEKFTLTLLGFLRIIASIFYSPILYFKKLFESVNIFGQKGEKEYSESEQYLLNKFLIIVKGVWILLGVLILGSGLVASWNSFLPPEYLRNQITSYEKQIHQLDSTFQISKAKFDQLENEWTAKSAEIITKYRNDIRSSIDNASKENNTISNSYSSSPVFSTVNNFLIQNENTTSQYYLESFKNQAIGYSNNNSPDDNSRQQLAKYAENWYLIRMQNIKLNNANDTAIRNEVQPEYSGLKNEIDSYNSYKSTYESSLVELRKEAKYNFSALLLGLLSTIISFIIFMWFVGLVTELMFLVVDLAGNVKKLRTVADNEFTKELKENNDQV